MPLDPEYTQALSSEEFDLAKSFPEDLMKEKNPYLLDV